MSKAAEAEISFESKTNRKRFQPYPGGGSGKDPGHDRLCGLSYLVVDDSRFARAMIKTVLHALGIRNLSESETAEQAMNLAKRSGIDVVFTDFELPGMNGAEFVWRLRRWDDERVRRIPVIMISKYADAGHIRIAINSGVNEYIPKPFSRNGLYLRLRRSVLSPKPFIVAPGYVGPDRRIVDGGAESGVERRSDAPPPAEPRAAAGPEPDRNEAAESGTAEPAPKPNPSFSALSETAAPRKAEDGGLAATLKERIEDKREAE
ncbi:MAG: response regulator [Rhodospirillales bacterium]|nr:response regulator [Rhodospirillales bacterium]